MNYLSEYFPGQFHNNNSYEFHTPLDKYAQQSGLFTQPKKYSPGLKLKTKRILFLMTK